jgi:hypothetical protein
MKLIPILFVALTLLVSAVSAAPVTGAATLIGNNNVTISALGGVGDVWIQYGTQPDKLNFWSNVEPAAVIPAGNTFTITGGPIYPSTTYYYKGCDSTGCDATVQSFTTTALTPMAVSTLGTAVTNMTKTNFNMLNMPQNLVVPYAWLFPTDTQQMSLTIVFGMLMMFIYIGMWLRTRSVATGVVLGILTSSFILFSNQGLNLGIPVEFANIAQGLLYASLAAILLTFLKK